MRRALTVAATAVILMSIAGVTANAQTPWEELFRLPIPEELPPHPRVFCTQADIDRIRADYEAGDFYTRVCVDEIVGQAEGYVSAPLEAEGRPGRAHFQQAATLAQAWALHGDEEYGRRALEILLWAADVAPTLEPTGAAGLFTSSTLMEGPLARDASMAYDLIAAAPFVTDAQRRRIENDLLREIGWASGHGCRHLNSSNWRSWGMAICAATGFAAGDFELIDEAINGAWDPERERYLYGIVQQIAHTIFADGIHWERSIGYTNYTASALMQVLVPAENCGIDIWNAEIPGILEPFVGGADHNEFGPPGPRSVKYMLDAPFYFAFQDGSLARINDSGTRRLSYHPIYELAWKHYRDPKYAWLISRERATDDNAPPFWSVWQPAGESEASVTDDAFAGEAAWRLKTAEGARVALVQNVQVPAERTVVVTGRVKALEMDGSASAHIRINWGDEVAFTDRVREVGDWTEVRAEIEPVDGADAGQMRSLRLHVFLENGAGEVIWDDVRVTLAGGEQNLARNGDFEAVGSADGRPTDFWSLVHSPADVPAAEYSLAEDATIGLVGRHVNGCTNFPVGGFTILRGDPVDIDAPAVNVTWGPYGSGHDHPDRLAIVVYGQGDILCPDAGSWGYDNPMHLTWANQTIAHNTLTVDEVAQQPQGTSNSIWANGPVTGEQRLFHAGEMLKATRTICDQAYEGVLMDRTTCIVGDYIVDIFRATSDAPHTYDLALHGPGELSTGLALEAAPEGWLSARGYEHLTDVRRGACTGLMAGTFERDGRRLTILHAPLQPATAIVAGDPVRSAADATTAFISRADGEDAAWVTVLEPHAGEATVQSLTAERVAGGLRITVTHADGQDVLTAPDDLAGALTLVRLDAAGTQIAREEAPAL